MISGGMNILCFKVSCNVTSQWIVANVMAYVIGTTYLDHTGTTLYAKSLVTAISHDLTSNLFGNPHSGSPSSQLSSTRIDDTRVQVLRFLNADPELFDVVFVANATAAIKLVAEAFRDQAGGFWYSYHVDSHTSLVGVRELAELGSQCLVNDDDVNEWLAALMQPSDTPRSCTLFGYTGQSNLSGYRPPLDWCSKLYKLRKLNDEHIYSLYDAAARLSTASMDFSDPLNTPDFTALSFYKIFGLPDLGALIVRKECSHIFHERKFFGGGTVDMIISLGAQWHESKQSSLHSRLEDGTVPFHSIIALGLALSTHSRLFGSMNNISIHTSFLARRVHRRLSSMRHSTGVWLCQFYGPAAPDFGGSQGPTMAFNLRDARGNWIGKSEVEKLAAIRGIQLRTGGLCNPGGIATHLQLSAPELRQNCAAGQRCGDANDIMNGKPTGVIRVSFGAMSDVEDADTLVDFIEEFFLPSCYAPLSPPLTPPARPSSSPFYVHSLSVFPIKSCAAFKIPACLPWEILDKGLAWDREWCLIHLGTGVALNQKRYPRMALLQPSIDLQRRVLRVQHDIDGCKDRTLEVSLEFEVGKKGLIQACHTSTTRTALVCGESQEVQVSNSTEIADFFTAALEVPCTLARHRKDTAPTPPDDELSGLYTRAQSISGYFPDMRTPSPPEMTLLANDSPILLVSLSSVNHLNFNIRSKNPAAEPVPADSFRGNIVIAQDLSEKEMPYAEDHWSSVQIGEDQNNRLQVLGPCHRCQMVCVDQQSAQRRQEPFSTLAKTRRRDGKVWFGMHLSPVTGKEDRRSEGKRFIRVGDVVKAE